MVGGAGSGLLAMPPVADVEEFPIRWRNPPEPLAGNLNLPQLDKLDAKRISPFRLFSFQPSLSRHSFHSDAGSAFFPQLLARRIAKPPDATLHSTHGMTRSLKSLIV
jgi:hypothetical protein